MTLQIDSNEQKDLEEIRKAMDEADAERGEILETKDDAISPPIIRRRKKGGKSVRETDAETRPEAPRNPFNPNSVAVLAVGLFDIIADRWGEHWQLTESEAETLGDTGADCIEYYLEKFGKNFPLYAFLGVFAIVVIPRYRETRRRKGNAITTRGEKIRIKPKRRRPAKSDKRSSRKKG